MHFIKRLSWRRWPIAAGTLAVLFIAYGVSLVSRSRVLQQRIATEVRLLDELGRLSEAVHQLGLTHRVDVSTRQYQWQDEYQRLGARVRDLQARFSGSPGMDELGRSLGPVLHQADSLHLAAMGAGGSWEGLRPNEAILQFMLQRAQKVVDRTARNVHEEGLGAHAATLSARWDEAQWLLVAACVIALALAWLTGLSNRLLIESRTRAEQLDEAKRRIETANRELRETMLSKEEKEVMIKEIHHRVKNNLQIVKSLIRFQMDQVRDEGTLELFNECVNRVGAMALVHEQTYLSKDLANIDVGNYLSHLTRDLCYAYTIDTKLDLDIRISVPTLPVDTLIPLGLLINEVISNSLKYAFKGRERGTVLLHLDGGPGGTLHLRIGDDGAGLPDHGAFHKPQSLGMELIHTLAGQLDASIGIAKGPGTVYELVSMPVERRKRA